METITISLREIQFLPEMGRPIFRNRKEYRRYRVAMKRMAERIDEQMQRAMFGPIPPQPPAYPPPRAPRQSLFSLNISI